MCKNGGKKAQPQVARESAKYEMDYNFLVCPYSDSTYSESLPLHYMTWFTICPSYTLMPLIKYALVYQSPGVFGPWRINNSHDIPAGPEIFSFQSHLSLIIFSNDVSGRYFFLVY